MKLQMFFYQNPVKTHIKIFAPNLCFWDFLKILFPGKWYRCAWQVTYAIRRHKKQNNFLIAQNYILRTEWQGSISILKHFSASPKSAALIVKIFLLHLLTCFSSFFFQSVYAVVSALKISKLDADCLIYSTYVIKALCEREQWSTAEESAVAILKLIQRMVYF